MMFDYFKAFWDWADKNPDRVNTTTAAIYFHFLHIANSLRWKESFGVTAGQTMEALGIGSVKTYRKHFEELIEVGLIEIKKRSINQYSCHVIALPKITQPTTDHVTYHVPNQLPSNDLTNYPSDAPIHKTNKTVKTDKTIKTKGADLDKVYSENELVNKHFIEFLKNRIEIKKPATQRAADLLVSEMRKLYKTPDEAIQGINQSIMKGWTGLFPIGSQNIKPEPPKTINRSSANHYV
jgi:hypothetical protein